MGLLSPGWSWRPCGRILAQDPAPEGVGAAHGPDGEKQRVSQEKKDACVTSGGSQEEGDRMGGKMAPEKHMFKL